MDAGDVVRVLKLAAEAVAGALASVPPEQRLLRASGHHDQYAVDLAADGAAVELINSAGLGVLSEESGHLNPERAIQVVLDPIDGSTNCSRNIDPYGPSLCAVDDRGPLAAVVANLAAGTTYTAIRGGGSWRDGIALRAPLRDEVGLVATGDPVPELEGLAWTRVSGASAHDLCRVADGSFDGYVDRVNTQSVWDYLGAMLVLTEAGGVVRERSGQPLVDLEAREDRRLIAATSTAQLARIQAWLDAPKEPHSGRVSTASLESR